MAPAGNDGNLSDVQDSDHDDNDDHGDNNDHGNDNDHIGHQSLDDDTKVCSLRVQPRLGVL